MFFTKLSVSDISFLQTKLYTADLLGSDSSLGTMFLLQNRYDITFAITDDFLFRYYNGHSESQKGYLFPIRLDEKADYETAVKLVYEDSQENNRPFNFCLCTKNQTEVLEKYMKNQFPQKNIVWKSDAGDSDYIYLQEKLCSLSGSKLQKKRNHVNQFKITYENQWKFIFVNKENYSQKYKEQILQILKQWQSEKGELSQDFILEDESIRLALDHFSELNLLGGILLVSGFPVAFTIGSKINEDCIDIHFEKAVSDYARNGGFAVINQLFVSELSGFKYVNREEDMNIEGLRKAKLSYKPEFILEKYYLV